MPALDYDVNRFLVVDDEREHIQFLPDYLIAQGLEVDIAVDAGSAQELYRKKTYRGYIVDLNIPIGQYNVDKPLTGVQREYTGLRVIQEIRTQGVSGARVLAYSAHENEVIKSEIERLYCGYEVKGRVRDLKSRISDILHRDPQRV